MNAKAVPLSGTESRTSYLARLLDVLDVAVTHDHAPLQLGEIATAAAVPPSTASRLVSLLVDRGFLVPLHGSGYAAGPRLLHLAVRTLDQVHAADRLKASVETLAEQTGESATAGLLVGNEIVLVARKEPAHSLRAVARVGDVLHPHTSAMGKAVLAMLPTPRQLDILRTAVGEHAEQALTDTHAELATAREQGFAVDEESYAIGLRCRAAAILDRSGHAVGGISIAGPAARFTRENANACVPALLAETKRLSLEIRSTR